MRGDIFADDPLHRPRYPFPQRRRRAKAKWETLVEVIDSPPAHPQERLIFEPDRHIPEGVFDVDFHELGARRERGQHADRHIEVLQIALQLVDLFVD